MILLGAIALTLFKGSLNMLSPRQSTLAQNITDAYMTFEKAQAERIDFVVLTSDTDPNNLWTLTPTTEADVNIGNLPGGQAIRGDVIRVRIPDPNNLSAFGGTGDSVTNPSGLQTWQLQSHLTYTIAGRQYVKSRTVVRTQ